MSHSNFGHEKYEAPPTYDAPAQPAFQFQGEPPRPQSGLDNTAYCRPAQYDNVIVQQPVFTQIVVNQQPRDYMLYAVLVTLFCFWPIGIIAIMKASEAREAARQGDMARAHILFQSAKRLIMISVVVGVFGVYIGLGVFLSIYLTLVMNTSTSEYY